MRKIIFITIAVLIIAALALVFYFLKQSGNIDDFSAYYHNDTAKPANGSVKVTFLGVSSLLIDDGETQLLIDGFFSRPSIFSVATSKISSNEKIIDEMVSNYGMDRVKAIAVTHSHYDHAFDVAYVCKKTKAHLYGSASTLNIGKGGGLTDDQMSLYEVNKPLQIGRFTLSVIPSKHSPSAWFNDDIGKTIDEPLEQPAKSKEYVEGDSFDFMVQHGGHNLLIKPSANYIKGAFDNIQAEVVFLGVGSLGKQSDEFRNEYYAETVGKLKPKIVIPVHWDNFFEPFSEHLEMIPNFMGNGAVSFEYIAKRTNADHIQFKILQGGKSILLFGNSN